MDFQSEKSRLYLLVKMIISDLNNALKKDPAYENILEALLTSPGLHAIWSYRFYRKLYLRNHRILSLLLSYLTRFFTGIEIHPGAAIGNSFYIDHGMGVVIGGTTIIGKNVTIYQGVTLGSKGFSKIKRHPTIEDNVVIGAHAIILGDITISANQTVKANSLVTRDM